MLEVQTVVSQCKEIAVLEDWVADYLGRYHGVLSLFTKCDDRKITLNTVLTEQFQYAEYSQWQVGLKVLQISLPFYRLQVENDMNERASEWCSAVPVPHPLDCLEKLDGATMAMAGHKGDSGGRHNKLSRRSRPQLPSCITSSNCRFWA